MKIIVLGAGIAGTAAAWYLSEAGHDVTVIDRADAVAAETSAGNAGQLSFGYTTPWAAPCIPLKALKWMFRANSPLTIRPDGSWAQLQWLMQMLANCTEAAYARNQSRMMRISEYSRAQFERLPESLGIAFERRRLGTLHLFRDAAAFQAHQGRMGVLEQFDVPYQVLSAQECLTYEPALAHLLPQIAGAFRLPNDQTGNCRVFTEALAEHCRAAGVRFELGRTVERLDVSGSRVTAAVAGGGERYEADAFVCALGSYSRALLQQIGLKLPVYPIKGYSLTIPLENEDAAPQSTVLDETYKVALTRLDGKMRVGGMAELCGYNLSLPPVHRETLSMVAAELFPQAGTAARAEYWCGLRPTTPDSTPIVGRTRFDNLFTNTGHGTLGWTMSLGSAKIVADLIHTGQSEVAFEDLALARYS